MNGNEFVRRAKAYAKARALAFGVEPSRGKGGHRMICVGERRITVKTGEIGPGLLSAMLRQLDIDKTEF